MITHLAARLEADIRARALKPGDAYLGTADAARLLRVSTSSANRALQLLTLRKVLQRSQRKGTFIAAPSKPAGIRRVHLLVRQEYLKTEGMFADVLLLGMQAALPKAELRFDFLQADAEAPQLNALVATALRRTTGDGFVLVRASLEAQRIMAASGLPAVVHGVLYPSVTGLAAIDRDHAQLGRVLCEYLLQRGYRRIAMLIRDRVLPGHHLALDAIRDTMTAAGLAADALTSRYLPADEQAIAAEVKSLLTASNEPLGIICRSKPLADATALAAEELALPPKRRPAIVVTSLYGAYHQPSNYTYARQVFDSQAIGFRIGQMLQEQANGTKPASDREVIPVELVRAQRRVAERKRDRGFWVS